MLNMDLGEIKKSQSIMNNSITEIKSTLEGNNSRIAEANERINEVKDSVLKSLSFCLSVKLLSSLYLN